MNHKEVLKKTTRIPFRFKEYREKKLFFDFEIQGKKQNFRVHKIVLAKISEKLSMLFIQNSTQKWLKINNGTDEEISALLNSIYDDSIDHILEYRNSPSFKELVFELGITGLYNFVSNSEEFMFESFLLSNDTGKGDNSNKTIEKTTYTTDTAIIIDENDSIPHQIQLGQYQYKFEKKTDFSIYYHCINYKKAGVACKARCTYDIKLQKFIINSETYHQNLCICQNSLSENEICIAELTIREIVENYSENTMMSAKEIFDKVAKEILNSEIYKDLNTITYSKISSWVNNYRFTAQKQSLTVKMPDDLIKLNDSEDFIQLQITFPYVSILMATTAGIQSALRSNSLFFISPSIPKNIDKVNDLTLMYSLCNESATIQPLAAILGHNNDMINSLTFDYLGKIFNYSRIQEIICPFDFSKKSYFDKLTNIKQKTWVFPITNLYREQFPNASEEMKFFIRAIKNMIQFPIQQQEELIAIVKKYKHPYPEVISLFEKNIMPFCTIGFQINTDLTLENLFFHQNQLLKEQLAHLEKGVDFIRVIKEYFLRFQPIHLEAQARMPNPTFKQFRDLLSQYLESNFQLISNTSHKTARINMSNGSEKLR